MRIVVDQDKCSALGICESVAPDLFEVQDDGSLVILEEKPGSDMHDVAREAVEGCPTAALTIIEDE